mgnify:CR=1 FL=1
MLKRLFDILFAQAMLTATLPLIAIISVLIKCETKGPVLFRQRRWGKNMRTFRALKFRTMTVCPDAGTPTRAGQRVTRFGALLRASGVDELPQILNILVGQMSFVGPRPLAVGETVRDRHGREIPYEAMRLFHARMRSQPGLTGLAAICLAKDTPPARKFRYDLIYLKKRTFCLDLRLIALTFGVCFRFGWEKMEKKR